MKNNKNFIYGIAVVTFGAMTIGWIEKGSWDWGDRMCAYFLHDIDALLNGPPPLLPRGWMS